jgi:hypothetical protein
MKTFKNILTGGAVAVAALFATTGTSQAQNTNHVNGDLVLFFQNPGGTTGDDQQFFASLGNTATVFRQAYVSQTNIYNFLNIGTQLNSTYGTNWANVTTLHGGLGGVWSASTGSVLQNTDPSRSIYSSMARGSVGTPGVANSSQLTFGTLTDMTTASTAIIVQNNIFETGATTKIASITNGVGTTIGGINPAGGSSWNLTVGAPGVQQQGSASNFGTFDTINNVQFMWDIYRSQARNAVSGQFGNGDPLRDGLFLGTMVLTTAGDLSFVTTAIPEPGTWVAGAVAALVLGAGSYLRSRRRAADIA